MKEDAKTRKLKGGKQRHSSHESTILNEPSQKDQRMEMQIKVS